MECRNCPYGKEDFDKRMAWYIKIVEERGIPNDIYGYETYEDAIKDAEQSLWCDKVGGKICHFGYCTDTTYFDIPKRKNHSKKKKRSKKERNLKYKNHLKYLAENISGYPSPAYCVDEIWVKGYGYIENPKPYYKRLYRSKRSKYLKRQSNKRIRKYKGALSNGWICHRLYDFWWEYN